MKKIIQYLKEVFQEFKKLTFPSKKTVFKDTQFLLLICLAIAFYLGLCDFVFSRLLQLFLR